MVAIKKNEIINFLNNNKKYFSPKNNCKIDEIVTSKKYYFLPDCGHEVYSLPSNIIHDNKIGCPICSGRIVLKGFNDLGTTRYDLIEYLVNKKDAYTHTAKSNKIVEWRCPYCGYEWESTINKMSSRKLKCVNCNNKRSYPEKFFECFLNQICEPYKNNITFDWSDRKQYDFWIYEKNIIVEVHGKQHYKESFSFRELSLEEINDDCKRDMALKNGVNEYIVIDCSISTKEWISKQISASLLPTILFFSPKDIDWDECDKYAMSNIVLDVCKDYELGKSIQELTSLYSRCRNTIKDYLKRGAEYGWCSYNPKRAKEVAYKKNGEKVIKTMSKKVYQIDLNNNIIDTFPSIQEAQRCLKISHIWDVISGRRSTAGGYKWRYIDDNE